MTTALQRDERARLAHLEARVERGLKSFLDVGLALLEMRESHLYRGEFASFGDYCAARWGISRQRGHQLLGSAEVAANLSASLVPPTTERQVRPLKALPPDRQVAVWNAAVESAPRDAKGRPNVSGKHVQKVRTLSTMVDKPSGNTLRLPYVEDALNCPYRWCGMPSDGVETLE